MSHNLQMTRPDFNPGTVSCFVERSNANPMSPSIRRHNQTPACLLFIAGNRAALSRGSYITRVPAKHIGSVDSSVSPHQINASVLKFGFGFQCQSEFKAFKTLLDTQSSLRNE